MPDNTRLQWVSNRADLKFPKSGLLEELNADGRNGAIGFRPAESGCELWHEAGVSTPNWGELLQRVTEQARKAKYKVAVFSIDGPLPVELVQALESAGFSGQPWQRPLVCDASEDLLPYLDWKGRLTRLAEGKGSDAINARLYEILVGHFPDEGVYTEVEVNAVLNAWHLFGDPAAIRRELIDRGPLARTRDCRQYWKVVEFTKTNPT
jgi:hypothetical protein